MWLVSEVKAGGMNNANTAYVLSVGFTDTVPYVEDKNYADDYTIHYMAVMSENELADTEKMKAYIEENYPVLDNTTEVVAIVSGGNVVKTGAAGSGENSQMRLVVVPVEGVEPAIIKDKKLVARLVSKEDGAVIWMDTIVVNAEVRTDGNWNVEVNWTDTVPYVKGKNYASDHTIAYVITEGTVDTENAKAYIGENYPLTEETVAVENVTLDQSELVLKLGDTTMASVTLTATVAPENAADKTVTWTSSDANVATVADGVVTGVAAGTATITAITNNGKAATCAVMVVNDAIEVICEGDVSKTGVNTSFEGNPMRMIVAAVEGVEPTTLIGKKIVARLVNKEEGTVIWMDTMVVNAAVRDANNWNVEVGWTDTVPYEKRETYTKGHTIVYAVTDNSTKTEMVQKYIQENYSN